MLATIGYGVASFVIAFVLAALLGSDGGALSKEFPWQFRLAAACRTPVLMLIVVPLSFIRGKYTLARRRLRRYLRGPGGKAAAIRHAAHVDSISEQLRAWDRGGRKRKLRTARSNWAAMSTKLGSNKEECNQIALGHMNEILDVDEDGLTLTCEPGVTMGELTDELLPLGLMLQSHIEMESITIGGLAMGFGIETNSHKVGLFQESVLEYEFVDSHGRRHSVTKDQPELFYALPWSYGTVGFLTSLKVKLLRTQPYVRVEYLPTSSAAELTSQLQRLAALGEGQAPDFLEATLYDRDNAVIQAGYFDARPSTAAPLNRINVWYKPFYYRHVETALRSGAFQESIPLQHFLHRFTRSIFWELEDMIPFSNHPLYRALWGWLGPPEVSLLKLAQGPVIRRASVYAHVVQESIMPLWRLPEGIAKFDDWFGAYPLLVFPVRIFDHSSETGGSSGLLTPRAAEIEQGEASGLWVDLGAYGVPRAVREGAVWDAKENIRAMEHWTREVGGWQALYTDIFCTPTELRQMFDFSLLDKARKRHDGVDAFPEVYDKVKSEAGISDLSAELAAERAAAKKGTAAGRRSQSAATSVKSPPRRRSRSRSPRPIRG